MTVILTQDATKHDWDNQDRCKHCGVTAEAVVRWGAIFCKGRQGVS